MKSKIVNYFHCGTCKSGQLAVGLIDETTLQVYCEDCSKPVVNIRTMPLHLHKCDECNKEVEKNN